MAFLDTLKFWVKHTEEDVIKTVVAIKHGLEYAEKEVKAGFSWLFDHADEIAAAVATVAGVVASLNGAGVRIPSSVTKAVRDANIAVEALNKLVADNEGQDKDAAQLLVDTYNAAQQAWLATEKATLEVTNQK